MFGLGEYTRARCLSNYRRRCEVFGYTEYLDKIRNAVGDRANVRSPKQEVIIECKDLN